MFHHFPQLTVLHQNSGGHLCFIISNNSLIYIKILVSTPVSLFPTTHCFTAKFWWAPSLGNLRPCTCSIKPSFHAIHSRMNNHVIHPRPHSSICFSGVKALTFCWNKRRQETKTIKGQIMRVSQTKPFLKTNFARGTLINDLETQSVQNMMYPLNTSVNTANTSVNTV